jgi:hypothetical protein
VALLLGPHISLPDSFAPAATLEARIEAPPPRPKPIPKKPRPAKPKPRKAAPAKPAAQPSAPAAQNGSAEAKPKQAPQPPTEPEGPATAETPPPMPRHAKIQFIIYKGLDGLAVGRATQTWDSDGRTYTLSQVAEASGLFSLFVSGKHVQESRGEITAAGLHPLSFRTERGSRAPEKIDTAQFDWAGNRLNLVSGGEARTADLPADAQDQLSFIYQLAWAPPEDGVRLHITSGRKIDTYTYMAVGEETLDTPLGPLKTLHISRHRNSGEEGTDIWLAEDYHYLPVKVRLTDKNGDSAEQVVSKIQVTEQE